MGDYRRYDYNPYTGSCEVSTVVDGDRIRLKSPMVFNSATEVAEAEAAHTRELRRLRKALEWIQERCSVIGSLTPCYPLASGLWDVCDKALAADQGETGGSDDKG